MIELEDKDMKKEVHVLENGLVPTSELVAGMLGKISIMNEEFHTKLSENPRQVLNDLSEDDAGELPSNLQVHTVQNTGDVVHVPVPAYVCLDDFAVQLSDRQLQDIAGGEVVFAIIVGLGVVGTAVTLGAVGGGAAVAIGLAVVVGITALAIGATTGATVAIAAGTGAI